jgi:hypothetical protein
MAAIIKTERRAQSSLVPRSGGCWIDVIEVRARSTFGADSDEVGYALTSILSYATMHTAPAEPCYIEHGHSSEGCWHFTAAWS